MRMMTPFGLSLRSISFKTANSHDIGKIIVHIAHDFRCPMNQQSSVSTLGAESMMSTRAHDWRCASSRCCTFQAFR